MRLLGWLRDVARRWRDRKYRRREKRALRAALREHRRKVRAWNARVKRFMETGKL